MDREVGKRSVRWTSGSRGDRVDLQVKDWIQWWASGSRDGREDLELGASFVKWVIHRLRRKCCFVVCVQ